MDLVQHALVLRERSLAALRDFELTKERGERRSQLMRCVAREALLAFEFHMQAIE